jgi:hypothetical protein
LGRFPGDEYEATLFMVWQKTTNQRSSLCDKEDKLNLLDCLTEEDKETFATVR